MVTLAIAQCDIIQLIINNINHQYWVLCIIRYTSDFASEKVTIRIMIRRIIIIAASLFVTFGIYAQELTSHNNPIGKNATICGKVTDSDTDEIINYATVYLRGTSYSGSTNDNGEYKITAPAGDYIVSLSAIGFEIPEKKVTQIGRASCRERV